MLGLYPIADCRTGDNDGQKTALITTIWSVSTVLNKELEATHLPHAGHKARPVSANTHPAWADAPPAPSTPPLHWGKLCTLFLLHKLVTVRSDLVYVTIQLFHMLFK